MTDRRFFGSRERVALYLAADGHCPKCGDELQPGWHADHIEPHVYGGVTDVINGQALCPRCNLKKGARVDELRKWQADALREFSTWRPRNQSDGFLVEATPGAGKTRFAIELSRRLLQSGRVERIVVMVPTSVLEDQWHKDFAEAGINVSATWHAADGRLPSDERGCAVTYGEVQFSAQNFRRLIGERPTLLILDEVHHCGDDRSWGDAVRIAGTPAAVKLLLSGTPFRSDNNTIPFVPYVDGVGAPDVRYGYDQALADRVVRAVFFPRRGGLMEWDDPKGNRREHTFAQELNDRDAKHRLRTALLPSGDWLPSVLADADSQLMALRENDPTAGGIVFCEDTGTARSVVEMLSRLGRTAVLVVTEEPEADDRIKAFRNSRATWIVSIRKVSEGVDIRRLRIGVYATPWVTELFFRQVVGRIVRTAPSEEDPTAWLYIPDDERLRALAASIKRQRDHVLNEQQGELYESDGASSAPPSRFVPIGASPATDEGTTAADGSSITVAERTEAERIKSCVPGAAGFSTDILAMILREAGATVASDALFDLPGPVAPDLADRKANLTKANNSTARRIVAAYGVQYKVVNGQLNNLVGVTKIRQASEAELEKRLGYASRWLASGECPRSE